MTPPLSPFIINIDMKTPIKLFVAVACAIAFGSGAALAADAVNKNCPISGKAADGSKSVKYTAEFCCGKCVAKFEKDPTAYAAKVAKAEKGKCAFSGKAVSESSDVHIAVCCGKCEKKVKADPGKFFAKLQKK